MCGSSQSYNFPEQPSYGEGMADALKAQVELLTGTGDFAEIAPGGLEGLLPLEENIRKKTAQTDTDILRQTLLGREQKETTGTYDSEGRLVVGYSDPTTGEPQKGKYTAKVTSYSEKVGKKSYPRTKVELIDTDTGKAVATANPTTYTSSRKGGGDTKTVEYDKVSHDSFKDFISESEFERLIEGAKSGNVSAMDFMGVGQETPDGGKPQPIYAKDPNGNTIVDTSKAGQTETIPASFSGDGMINLLGDSRNVQGEVGDFESYVQNNGDVKAAFERAKQGGDSRTIEEFGRDHYNKDGRSEGRELPTMFGVTDRKAGFDADGNFLGLSALAEDIQRGNLSRQREADLADVERLSDRYQDVMADYKPAATSGLDGARELLEEQKEAMTTGGGAITKPTGSTFASGLEGQTMTAAQVGQGPTLDASTSYTPSADVSGGTFDAGTSYTASQVADPLRLQAATSFDPSASVEGQSYTAAQAGDPMALTAATSYDPSASVTGRGYTATAGVEGGNIGADTLRAALLADAETALGQGLTEREQAQIANSARARQTLMGRTFDQSGAIQEAQALVAEDNNRRMQNRGFAQSALGQEADIQRDDLGRGLQAQLQNQAALNQAAQFGASQDMQAQLANQAARNQALQQGVTAGLSQEALAAQQRQAAQLSNQAAANRAAEFGASTAMDAQRLNQVATNQALSQGLQAGLSQEALAAQQAQAKAMADASAANQASQFGVSAGLQQEATANQAGLQAQLANQAATNQARAAGMEAGLSQDAQQAQLDQASNLAQAELTQQANAFGAQSAQQAAIANQAQQQQAKQFGVGAEMDAERLNETLRQQGLGNYINAVGNLARMEDQYMLDPFQALLGRGGGGSLQSGQSVFGQAGYGLNSGPQYLNPEAGLGYISQNAANQANMYAANVAGDATKTAGIFGGLGSIGGGIATGLMLCWVAREVYGPTNPAWMQFREWMFNESPQWFFELYAKYGERFASWISNKPRLKGIIRKWMDSKIGDK
jgi:hypothetical protein